MTAPAVVTSDKTASSIITGPKFLVPLREEAITPDPRDDGRRLNLARNGWSFFDDLVRQQNRQIEENVRMVSGQHHSIYHPAFGRWLDVSEWMSAEERAYRARPVFNRLLPWYIITHARATENQPIVSFVPGPDRTDAELANVLDIAMKSLWFEANMEDVHDRLMGWVMVAGRGHLFSRIDPQGGQMRKWEGEDMVPVVDAYDRPVPDNDGGQAMMPAQGVRFDAQGKPVSKFRMIAPGQGELIHSAEAHATPVGTIKCDVLSPMQVRGSWGPQPWHEKRRHYIRGYYSPEEVYDMFGVEVEPDVRGGSVSDVGELERLLFGTGFYGANSGLPELQAQSTNTDGYVEVTQMWEAPCGYGGLEKTNESAGGRWLVTSRTRVIRDGIRPAAFPYTSPLNTFEFVRIPGRPGGTTPLEALNPIQRAINDGHGRIQDHVNLSTNPKAIIDANAGLLAGKFTNKPGENYVLQRRPGVAAIEYVAPPPLGEDVYKRMMMMREEFNETGFMQGQQSPAAPGDSGEKVKEVRFDTDRFLGPTMRRSAGEYGRTYENWLAMLPTIWDLETTISYAGDDNIAQTITVYPEMFKQGKVNVRADVESMLPEGRGEKQEKAYKFYAEGLFGLPGSPQALAKFWEVAHMPHLSRMAKVGGIDATTAEQENGRLLQGAPAQEIPVYEWYDDEIHLMVLEKYMKSPEFEKQDPTIKDQFVLHRQAHQFNMQTKMAKQVMQAAAMQNALQPPQQGGGGGGRPGKAPPAGAGSVRPTPPTPPTGGVPGGAMPTAAGAA